MRSRCVAKIAIIKPLYRMTLTVAQLCGDLVAAGHEPLVIFFKKQEIVYLPTQDQESFQFGDQPMRGIMVSQQGVQLTETSAWKKTKQGEMKSLIKLLKDFQPDAIGFSSLSNSMTLCAEMTEELRKHFNVPFLWGGTGPTLEPEKSMESADLVCVGEGEEVIVEIAEKLDRKELLTDIAGTWCNLSNGEIQKNPKRPVPDLEKIAVPCWEEKYYAFINGPFFIHPFKAGSRLEDTSYQIMTQRGCPFSCSFCVESVYQRDFGKKDSLRRMSPQKAIRELVFAKENLGYKSVTFMDDVFTVNPRWMDEFLPLYKEQVGLPFFCYTYPTTHTPDMLAKLKDAGCMAMAMGVQSGSERILNDIYERKTNIKRIVKSAQDIVDAGIHATFDMIPMTAFDCEEDLRSTFELVLQIPKEMDASFWGEMAYFPNYPILDKFNDKELVASSGNLDFAVYEYYFKLFELTRTSMPVEQIQAMADDPRFRADHNLLNPFMRDEFHLVPSYGTLIDEALAVAN